MKNQIIVLLLSLLQLQNAMQTCKTGCLYCEQSQNVCYSCSSPTASLFVDGTCQQLNRTVSNCISYYLNKQCASCDTTFKLVNKQCLKDTTGCIEYDGTIPKVCAYGTKLDKNVCKGTLNCIAYDSNNKCTQCENGFNLTEGFCKLQNGCSNYTNDSVCIQCSTGFNLVGFYCLKPEQLAQSGSNCALTDINGNCIKCRNGYTLKQGICSMTFVFVQVIPVQIPITTNSTPLKIIDTHCMQFTNGICVVCSLGYKLNALGVCALKTNDTNCLIPDVDGKCLKCADKFWSNNGYCTIVNSACKASDIKTGNCLSCYAGLRVSNGACVPLITDLHCAITNPVTGVCQKCSIGYYKLEGVCAPTALQCANYDYQGKCRSCFSGYSLNNGTCVLVQQPNLNCQTYIDNKCVACKQRYFLSSDNCSPVSPSCNQYNSQNGYCLTCFDLQVLKNNYCQDVNCLVSIEGICQQCVDSYYFESGKCLSIPVKNCNVYQNQKCIKCAAKYYLLNETTCTAVNPSCKDFDPLTGKCLTCNGNFVISPDSSCLDPNCQLSANGSCTLCNHKMYLDNNICKPILVPNCDEYSKNLSSCVKCSDRYFISNLTCVPVNVVCNLYNMTNGYCISCIKGYEPDNNSCKDANCNISSQGVCSKCLDGFYLDSNSRCKNNDAIGLTNCDQSNGNICTKCSDRYFWNGKQCKLVSKTCKVYNADGTCTTCMDGFKLSIQQYCVDLKCSNSSHDVCNSCLSTYYLSNSTCVAIPINNCQQYVDPNCIKCLNRFYLTSNFFCNPVNPTCDRYNKDGKCITCIQTGYVLAADGYCMSPNCSVAFLGNCRTCKQGFYLLNSSQCTVIPVANCLTYEHQVCTSCISAYALINGQCQQIQSRPQYKNCNQSANGKCVKCNPGSYLANSICKQISPLCASSDPINGNCLTCYVGYRLINGTCEKIQIITNKFVNCKVVSNGVCIECILNYWKQGNNCIPLTKTCLTYDMNTGLCLSCAPYYALTPDGDCSKLKDNCKNYNSQQVCTACQPTFTLINNGTCVASNPLCATVNYATGQCQTCYDSYSLINGNCISKTADPNCQILASNGICQQCSTGFYFKHGRCNQVSPLCVTADLTNGNCLSCFSGYALSDGSCVVSQDPNCKVLSSGLCQICSQGYVVKQGKCSKISELCATFNSTTGDCLTCYQGYLNVKGSCVIVVQDPNCLKYQNGLCLNCSYGYVLNNNQCNQVSPLCAAYDNKTGLCTNCFPGFKLKEGKCMIAKVDPHCQSTLDGTCTQCSAGYRLQNNQCFIQDQQCLTIDPKTNLCSSCYQGYTLSNGVCIISANNDRNCQLRKGQFCLSCVDRYYLVNNICTPVSTQCNTYDAGTGYCTTCYDGYLINFGNCVPIQKSSDPYCQTADPNGNCLFCVNGYYVASQGSCLMISALCHRFDLVRSICTECESGYFLQDGGCIYPSMGLDPNCVRYSGGYCSKCKTGFFVYSYQCTPIDSACTKFNYAISVCQSCVKGKKPMGANCA